MNAIRAWWVWKVILWRPARKITLCVPEQLPTRLFIRTGDVDGKPAAGGMLLQVMPAQNAQQDDFDHLATLTETIKTEELLTLPANEVLWRLYHEEEVTVYDPQDVEFKCTCSRERCADALKNAAG